MNNSTKIILSLIVGFTIGGLGGYSVSQKKVDSINDSQVKEMTTMMISDGERMKKMGALMIEAGAMLTERGTKYKDEEMIMKGKDLTVNGTKHQSDGMSMTEGDMMGMTANGNMDDMPGMKM